MTYIKHISFNILNLVCKYLGFKSGSIIVPDSSDLYAGYQIIKFQISKLKCPKRVKNIEECKKDYE